MTNAATDHKKKVEKAEITQPGKHSKKSKKKLTVHSSLRHINKRYGRTIRFPGRLKWGKRILNASGFNQATGSSSNATPTKRNQLIFWGVIIALTLGLAGLSHIFSFKTIHTWGTDTNGWLLFALVLFLPLIGMPMSICGIMVGAKFGAVHGMEVTAVAVAFHLTASWVIARSWLRKPIQKLMHKTKYQLPSLEAGEYAGVCLLTALIPGPSYTLKNYFLALSKLPLRIILGVGLPANLFAMSPGVLFGSFAGAMNLPKIIFLVVYVLLLYVATHLVVYKIRSRSRRHLRMNPA